MAVEVLLPRLGWSMEAGSLVEWLKQDGDSVKPGDLICRIEGDKAIDEVESFDSGILRIPPTSPAPGAKVPVGTLLAYLVQPGEQAPFEAEAAESQKSKVESGAVAIGAAATGSSARVVTAPTGNGSPGTTTPDTRYSTPNTQPEPTISPRARRIAAELGVEWLGLQGSGRTGRIVERDVRLAAARAITAEEAAEATRVSPLARRIAEEAGVDLEQLARAKPGHRITRSDVEEAARAAASSPSPATGSGGVGPSPLAAASADAEASRPLRTTPLTGIRQIIATRMAESAHTVAPVTLTTEADATDLVRLREQIKADLVGSDLPVPSYNDLLAKLVAVALREHPALNASLVGSEIVQHASVHVGFAVDTERGLLVPVVRDVQARSVQQIALDSARLIQSTRSGHVSPDDLRGGTFTITNLGMYEIDAFTPIINLPEAAILGVGRIVARPVVVDESTERVAVRKMLALSLTFDHRLVDGAPAARFLQRVKHFVEHPTLWLIR